MIGDVRARQEAFEQVEGLMAPARAENDDPGMTVEEFQRQREERLGLPQRRSPMTPEPAPDDSDDYDLDSFDAVSLRSDR